MLQEGVVARIEISDSLEAIEAEDSESVPGLPKTRVVEIDEDDSVEAAADELDDQAGVRWAEPNYIVQTQSLPNDPKLGLLWGLRNVGQNSQLMNPGGEPVFGRPGVDIGAPAAWKKTTGSYANSILNRECANLSSKSAQRFAVRRWKPRKS